MNGPDIYVDIYITGGAWITPNGYGVMGDGKYPVLGTGSPVLPPDRDLFPRPHPRFGRFDMYTRLGCSAVALTLKDAGVREGGVSEPIGMVVSSLYEVMETDKAYYQTTLEEGGVLSSPNLFSYTLPVIVLGECSVMFNLTGPTFCVGEGSGTGINALQNAASVIASGKTSRMLAGWIDSPPANMGVTGDRPLAVSVFVILDAMPGNMLSFRTKVVYDKGSLALSSGRDVSSITDLFNPEE